LPFALLVASNGPSAYHLEMMFRAAGCLVLAALLVLSGCERKGDVRPEGPRLEVLCSFLPVWVFTKNVTKGVSGVEVDVLIPGHQGPHNYQLTPGDMEKIRRADLFIINGYGLEAFLEKVAEQSVPGLEVVKAGEAVEPLYVGEDGLWTDSPGEGGEVNPHVFASPAGAARMVQRIAEALASRDPEHAQMYRSNARSYSEELRELAERLRQVVASSENPRVATFHNAFDYLARDTGLEIVGVVETAPGQKPSAAELKRLADRISSSGARAVFAEPQFSDRIARVLADETGAPLEVLDPGATGELSPDSYVEIMERNLKTLEKVLQ